MMTTDDKIKQAMASVHHEWLNYRISKLEARRRLRNLQAFANRYKLHHASRQVASYLSTYFT